jgi:hypothetical protein
MASTCRTSLNKQSNADIGAPWWDVLGLRPREPPGCQLTCAGHPGAARKWHDAVRQEVARGTDHSLSHVGQSRQACVAPFRLTPIAVYSTNERDR